MGIHDRDYYRQPGRGPMFSSMRVWSVNTWLIVINVAVFIVDSLLGGLLHQWGDLTVADGVFGLQLWRFFTLQFLHFGVQHIAMNMFALFFFGPLVEQALGSRRYVAFYLLSGIASGLMYVVLWAVGVVGQGQYERLAGASGSIFGVLIAAAMIAPDVTVMFDFFIPMKLRTVAWVLLGIAVLTVFTNGHNAGGEAAHIGGAVAGYFLIRYPRSLSWVNYRRGPRMRYRP